MPPVDSEMLVYEFPSEMMEGWKSYPVRILGPRPSKCRNEFCAVEPTVIVQSMNRGFVSANCSVCGAKDTLSEHEFMQLSVWVSCPLCQRQMKPRLLSAIIRDRKLAGNYGYACFACHRFILLAHLLPSWEDLVARPA